MKISPPETKFTWKIGLKSGRILEYDLSEAEVIALKIGRIDFRYVLNRINEDLNEEDLL